MSRLGFLLTLVLAAVAAAGCQAEPATDPEQDTVAIYAAVIRRLYGPDDTFGGTLQPPTLYIIRATDDSAANPSTPTPHSAVIPETVQQGITTALADLPAKIVWVDRRDSVALEPVTRRVPGGGAMITLGNIQFTSRDRALVPGSIYIGILAAGGTTYVIQKADGVWHYTGNNGASWIS